MKRKLLNLLLVTLLLVAIPGTMILASDITGALYKMSITVSNNGTLANYVSTNGVISTPNLIAGGFLNVAAGNSAVQDTAGNDIAFMPGYSTNPWVFWVETIGSDAYLNYSLYTAESINGTIAYFPDTTGMIVSDNNTLELWNDFDVGIEGWVDTDTSASIILKDRAFRVFVSANTSISASIMTSGNVTPVENMAGGNWDTAWDNAVYATGHDADTGPLAAALNVGQTVAGNFFFMRGAVSFDTSAIPDDAVITSAVLHIDGHTDNSFTDFNMILSRGAPTPHDPMLTADYDISDYTDGIGGTWNSSAYAAGDNPINLTAIGLTWINLTGQTTFGLLSEEDINSSPPANAEFVRFDPASTWLTVYYSYLVRTVSAVNQSPDEYTILVSANTANLTISIDGAGSGDGYDTIALVGATVENNDNNWQFFLNDAMPYMLSANVIVAGNISAWEWEYDTIFHDSVGVNDATPTFRMASSDADVVATAVSFQPIEEAKAPAWTLSEETATWIGAGNVTGNFTTTPSPTYPGADVIEDIAAASGTPAQLPFVIIFGFVTLAVSLTISSVLRQYGSRSLAVKVIIIGGLLGIGGALGIVDFWMLVFFLILALAIMAASKPGEVV